MAAKLERRSYAMMKKQRTFGLNVYSQYPEFLLDAAMHNKIVGSGLAKHMSPRLAEAFGCPWTCLDLPRLAQT